MSMAAQDLFPQLAGWIGNLDDVFPGKPIKDSVSAFAVIEVGHIISLVILGGASILLNLRLLGAGLTDESPAEVNRNLRGWMHAGVIGILTTGLLIGSANAERLYTSQAFTAKMIGLVAGIILTYAVTLPATRNDGRLGAVSRVLSVIGCAIFAVALWVFYEAKLSNPGLWHVIMAGALITLFATRGLIRLVYFAGLAALVLAQQVMTHFIIKPDDFTRLDPANKAFAWAFVAWIVGCAIAYALRDRRDAQSAGFVRFMAYAATLVWVMTAAAGRWLAFA